MSNVTVKYKVLMFSVSDVHKLEPALNEAALDGYELKAMDQDISGRFIVVLEKLDIEIAKSKKSEA